jgi:ketosteroid isomerase-like protein
MTPEAMMRQVVKAFEMGDLQPLLSIIDEKTVWKTASTTRGLFRFGGEYKNRAGIVEVTAQIASTYLFRRFQPKEIVSNDGIAWGLFDVEVEHRPTGKIIEMEIALRWHVQNDMLREHQAFFDTADLLMQQGQPVQPQAKP